MKRMNAGWIMGILAAGLAAPAMAASDTRAALDQNMILSELHLSNMAEVEMGQLAAQKATTQQAKELAQMLIAHHSQNEQELQALAQSRGIILAVPEQSEALREKQAAVQDLMRNLQKATGAAFDREFVNGAIQQHLKDIASLRAKSEKLPAGPVRDFIERTIPVLDSHLQTAQRLKNDL